MDLTDPNDLKSLLGKFGIKPNEKMGQNFLIDKYALEKIISSCEMILIEWLKENGYLTVKRRYLPLLILLIPVRLCIFLLFKIKHLIDLFHLFR